MQMSLPVGVCVHLFRKLHMLQLYIALFVPSLTTEENFTNMIILYK